jgi:hypothetical protein
VRATSSGVGRARRGLVASLALVALISAGAPVHAAGPDAAVWVGLFDDGLGPWREVQLNAKLARNRFVVRDWDGVAAVEVLSERSMSLLARPLSIDLAATPVLCWRWRIDAPLANADMATRAGDDYAARVYVTLSIPVGEQGFALRAKLKLARAFWGADLPDAALNYVWDNRRPVGMEAPNAYTDRTMMIVQRSGSADAQRWVSERRDIGSDAARLFGASARAVQLAVTADTDNTGETARAGFADMHFVPADLPCVGAR